MESIDSVLMQMFCMCNFNLILDSWCYIWFVYVILILQCWMIITACYM